MATSPVNLNSLSNDGDKEHSRYVKKYLSKQDYWIVWQYIFTGNLPDKSWINETQ